MQINRRGFHRVTFWETRFMPRNPGTPVALPVIDWAKELCGYDKVRVRFVSQALVGAEQVFVVETYTEATDTWRRRMVDEYGREGGRRRIVKNVVPVEIKVPKPVKFNAEAAHAEVVERLTRVESLLTSLCADLGSSPASLAKAKPTAPTLVGARQ
jgi:hypothetical protein